MSAGSSTAGVKVALALGSALCVDEDVRRAKELGEYQGVVACNEMIARWPGRLDAAVSLHPEKLARWLWRRQAARYPRPGAVVISDRWKDWFRTLKRTELPLRPDIITRAMLPWQSNCGSSGLFAVKVALFDMGFDKVVCCGIPLTKTPHVNTPRSQWTAADKHRIGWREASGTLERRVRSMSGWTAELLGEPDEEWLRCAPK